MEDNVSLAAYVTVTDSHRGRLQRAEECVGVARVDGLVVEVLLAPMAQCSPMSASAATVTRSDRGAPVPMRNWAIGWPTQRRTPTTRFRFMRNLPSQGVGQRSADLVRRREAGPGTRPCRTCASSGEVSGADRKIGRH